MAGTRRVRVWDLFVRIFHWSLVATFAVAYFSTVGSQSVHNWSGYIALALVFARIVWGFIGSQHARFADFVPGPRRFLIYLSALLKRREPRHIGHNPAGALMILFLLAMVVGIGVTGWMLTLDAFWGSETVEDVHVLLTNITLGAVAIHVGASIYESWNHRENLIWSMIVGTKREASADDGSHAPDVARKPAGATPELERASAATRSTGTP